MTTANSPLPAFLNASQRAAADTILRAADLGMARPSAYVAARLEERTIRTSEAQRLAALAALLQRTLQDFTLLVYDPLPSGRPSGIDWITGILQIPAPWTTSSHRKWGLRRSEQAVLLRYMHAWERRPRIAPIFLYAEEHRRWVAALGDYPNLAAVQTVLQGDLFPLDIVAETERACRAKEAARQRARGK
jgi:hypothetical protein